MPKFRNRRVFGSSLHISRLFPNLVTLLGLCAGLSSIRFSLISHYEVAVIFLIIAVLLDGVDGRLARMLNSTSSFGAHLDSLCDLVNFGIAPALNMYLWKTHEARGFGWAFVLFFAICCALRLARFNTSMEDSVKTKKWMERFFTGVPAPGGAALLVLPMMLMFWFRENPDLQLHGENFIIFNPLFLALYMGIVGLLMASRIPTFSIKKVRVKRGYISLTLLLLGLFIISLIIEPWLTFPLIGLVYILSIPVSVFSYYRMKNRHSAAANNS